MTPTLRKSLWFAVRVVLALLLVGWALRQVLESETAASAPGGVRALFSGIDLALVAGALLCMVAAQVLGALRWRVLLAIQSVRLGVWEAVRLTWLAEFGALALPGALGGDAVRVLAAVRGTSDQTPGVLSVMMDRFIGVITMVGVAAAALAWAWGTGVPRGVELQAATVALAVAGFGLVGVAVVWGWLRRQSSSVNESSDGGASHQSELGAGQAAVPPQATKNSYPWILGGSAAPRTVCRRWLHRFPLIMKAAAGADDYRHQAPRLALAFVLSVGVQAAEIGAVILLGASLHLPLAWHAYVLYVPLVNLLSAVPLTPGALGVTEALYVAFLGTAADPGRVLALALLVRAGLIARALPGTLLTIAGSRLALRVTS